MKPVAICKNDKIFSHSTSWTPVWIKYCEDNNIPYEIVDCYQYDIIEKLDSYSVLLWNYSNYVISDLLEARNILLIAEKKGLKVFPNHNTGWHFDDKIAEMYALQSVNADIPNSWVFYLEAECIKWLEKEAKYPLVGKLRCGSGSSNVKMLRTKQMAIKYAKRMFSRGYDPSPSLLYKTYSKIQSTYDFSTFISRFKRIPEFLRTRKHAKKMPIEKGYCYFQEFIANDGFDIKVAVVGNKLSYLCRDIRKGDFRASGGGAFYYDNVRMNKQIIDSAFTVADKLGLQCVGFDYVVDNRTGTGKIIEMCYGFDHTAILGAGGYYDRDHIWHYIPLNIPEEVITSLVLGY